jgi:hypothetical protein
MHHVKNVTTGGSPYRKSLGIEPTGSDAIFFDRGKTAENRIRRVKADGRE